MTFTVIIYFDYDYVHKNKFNMDKAYKFYNLNPISKKSNGSVVAMVKSDYWLDFSNVTNNEITKLLKYIEAVDDAEFKSNIYLKIKI